MVVETSRVKELMEGS